MILKLCHVKDQRENVVEMRALDLESQYEKIKRQTLDSKKSRRSRLD